jgi:hypothetical protein
VLCWNSERFYANKKARFRIKKMAKIWYYNIAKPKTPVIVEEDDVLDEAASDARISEYLQKAEEVLEFIETQVRPN